VYIEKLSIVHVLRAPVGGLFRHVVDLAAAQSALGHRVGLFYDLDGRSARVEAALARIPGGPALGAGGARIRRNPGPSDLVAFAKFRGWLGRVRPDVIHGHGAKGGLYARLAAMTAPPGRPIVAYTPHGGSFNYRVGEPIHRLYMAVERALASATDVFLFESGYIGGAFDRYVGARPRLRRVVPNGLAEPEFEPQPPDADAADFVYVGELREAKGVDTLLDALARLRDEGRAARLTLVGDGPDAEILKARAARLGLAESVEFLGARPARDAFRRGRIFVVPSRQESMPYVVLEAAAAAVPMVATRVGGVPEIFGPFADRLGPFDDPRDLARRLAAMLDQDAESRTRDAEALRNYVRGRFTISAMTEGVLSGYREALSRRRAAGVAAPSPLQPRS